MKNGQSIVDKKKYFSLMAENLCGLQVKQFRKEYGIIKNVSDRDYVIHTGSRHLGLEVAKHYQELAYKQLKDLDVGDKIKAVIADLKAKGREKEIEKTIKALKMQEPHIPKSLCYVSGQAFKDYIHDMEIVQKHAELNRKYIADTVIFLDVASHCHRITCLMVSQKQ